MLCRHCHRNKASRPRGLCFGCYYSTARDLYPVSAHHCARRSGIEDFYGRAGTSQRPTSKPPGSWEKIRVLAQRASRRQNLHHADDAGLRDDGPDWSNSAESRANERRYLAAEAAREERRAWAV